MGLLSDMGQANDVALMVGTSLVLADVGLAGALALAAAGYGIADADCGTIISGDTSGMPCGTHHR